MVLIAMGEGGRGNSLINIGTDVRSWTLDFSGVNFCPGIRL